MKFIQHHFKHSKRVVLWAVALGCFVLTCEQPPGDRTVSEAPNIVIILLDDLGYGDVSFFNLGGLPTPTIDKLARESVVATDFYVPTPYCAPSRATLLTGRFPLRHGLTKNPTPDAGIDDIGIADEEVTIAETLADAGYRTMCIGKWHLGHKPEYFPLKHGFDNYYGILYSNDMRPVQIVENFDTVAYPVDQADLTGEYTARALAFIEKQKDNPFFLLLSHAMPHKPLAASADFYTPDTPDDLYADVLRELDWSVGQVLGKLKEANILENTILVFMSDNGPWYGGSTGAFRGMKATTWEGGIRVPFLIRFPGALGAPRSVDTPVWSPDLYPTLLSLAGLEVPGGVALDGEDISAILRGESTDHGPVFSMHGEHIMSVRQGEWKLFVRRPPQYRETDLATWVDPRGPDGTTIIAPAEQATTADYPGIRAREVPPADIQLYNLRADPSESTELSASRPKVVQRLTRSYAEFQTSLNLD